MLHLSAYMIIKQASTFNNFIFIIFRTTPIFSVFYDLRNLRPSTSYPQHGPNLNSAWPCLLLCLLNTAASAVIVGHCFEFFWLFTVCYLCHQVSVSFIRTYLKVKLKRLVSCDYTCLYFVMALWWRTGPVDLPSCNNMLKHDWINLPILFYHVNSAVTGLFMSQQPCNSLDIFTRVDGADDYKDLIPCNSV